VTYDYDAIVVGAGHNGLICAAYLARAGMNVAVIEARDQVGGCASTVSTLGARVNICNCDHLTFRTTPIADELGLADHGLRYLDVDPAQLSLSWTGEAPWLFHHDVDATLDSLRRTHPGEVDGYRRYVKAARPVAELVLELAAAPPTLPAVARKVLDRRARGTRTLLAWSRRTAVDVLRSFFRSDALLGPVLTTGPAVWGITGEHPHTGMAALGYAMKHVARVGRPEGGSGRLTDAVAASFTAAGGTVRCGRRVTAILVDGERVSGVELDDTATPGDPGQGFIEPAGPGQGDGTQGRGERDEVGRGRSPGSRGERDEVGRGRPPGSRGGRGREVLRAPVVVVACDPRRALLEWLRTPPAGAAEMLRRWADRPVHEGYESKVDAVVADPPRFPGFDGDLVPTAIVAPTVTGLTAAHRTMTEGRVAAQPPMFVNVPSVLDPTMRVPGPDGGHVLSLEVLSTPYSLHRGWAGSLEPERWLEALGSLAEPGFLDGVRRFRVMTPPDYERDFSLARGHAPSFAGGPLAALLGRDKELTRYRTPVRGLFLSGAATFPGAGVWGASGRNAAHVVLADL